MKSKRIFFFLLFYLLYAKLFAQSSYFYPTLFTAYYQNPAQNNPGYISTLGKADFSAGYKSMLGAFRKVSTYYFITSRYWRSPKRKVHVARIQLYNEKEGSYITTPRGYFNYAYSLPISKKINVYAGATLGIAGMYFSAPTTTQSSFIVPDGSVGLGIKSERFELGGSLMQIFNSRFLPMTDLIILKSYYQIYGSYNMNLSDNWGIKFQILDRNLPTLPEEIYGSWSVDYQKQIQLGASLKYKGELSFFTLISILTGDDQLQIMLNYNTAFLQYTPLWQNSAEIGLSYFIN